MQRIRDISSMQNFPGGSPALQPKSFIQDASHGSLLPSSSPHKVQPTAGYPMSAQDRVSGIHPNSALLNAGVTPAQAIVSSYADTAACGATSLGKRENEDARLMQSSAIKRPKHEGITQHQGGSPLDGVSGVDVQWKNPMLQQQQQQLMAKGFQYPTAVGGQKYPPQVVNDAASSDAGGGYLNQPGMKFGIKEERAEMANWSRQEADKAKNVLQLAEKEGNPLEQQHLRPQQYAQQMFSRPQFPSQTPWHIPGTLEKDIKKSDSQQKKKQAQSPRVSTGATVHSPVSSKSGEMSSGSIGGQFSTVTTGSALASQKEKPTVSGAAVGTPSVTSSPSDSMQRPVTLKRKPNQRNQAMGVVGSPASINNLGSSFTAASSAPAVADQVILDSFSKIEAVTQRYARVRTQFFFV